MSNDRLSTHALLDQFREEALRLQHDDAYQAKTHSEQLDVNRAFAASWQVRIDIEKHRVSLLQRRGQAERIEIKSRSTLSEEESDRIQVIEDELRCFNLFFMQINRLQAYVDMLSGCGGSSYRQADWPAEA